MRTDQDSLFFFGDGNENVAILRNVLMAFAVHSPKIGTARTRTRVGGLRQKLMW